MDEAQRLMRLRMGALRALEWSGVKGVMARVWRWNAPFHQ